MHENTYWLVRRIEQTHTCMSDQLSDGHRQASSQLIGELIKDKFADCSRIYTPKNIQADIQSEYGVLLSYSKAWRAKEAALTLLSGDPAASYNLLPLYCHVLKCCNNGTVTYIQKDNDNHFMYFFLWPLEAVITASGLQLDQL